MDNIDQATLEDLTEILQLQKKAFFPVATSVGNDRIPALLMDEDGILEDLRTKVILKYTLDSRIIGSVRAELTPEGVCKVGTLIVDPDIQGKGIGRQLMLHIEDHFRECRKYALFTSPATPHTSAMYQKLGYETIGIGDINGIEMFFMEKENR